MISRAGQVGALPSLLVLTACGGGSSAQSPGSAPPPAPGIGKPDEVIVPAGESSVTGNVLANDGATAATGSLTVVAVAAPDGRSGKIGEPLSGKLGTLAIAADGSYSYTILPGSADYAALHEGQTQTEIFTYTPGSGAGAGAAQQVAVTVTGINDAPLIVGADNPLPLVEAAGAGLQDIAELDGTITVVDFDHGDTLSITVAGDATTTLNGDAVPAGTDLSALIAASALHLGGSQVSTGGALTFGWMYDPAPVSLDWLKAGDMLAITFAVRVSDGLATATQLLTITIVGTDDAPVLVTGEAVLFTEGDAPIAVSPALILADPDGVSLSAVDVAITGNFHPGEDMLSFAGDAAKFATSFDSATGILRLAVRSGQSPTLVEWQAALRAVTYTNLSDNPDASSRAITLTALDASGQPLGSTASTLVGVIAVNDAPVLVTPDAIHLADTGAGDVLSATTGRLTATDPDSGSLAYAIGDQGASAAEASWAFAGDAVVYDQSRVGTYGTFYLNSTTGQYRFEPDNTAIDQVPGGLNPSESFTLTVSDGAQSDTRTFVINVAGANDAPVAVADTIRTGRDTPVTVAVLSNDSDADGDVLSVSAVEGQAITVGGSVAVGHGQVRLNADGTLTFTPEGGYVGPVSFTYEVADGNGATVSSSVSGAVTSTNDAPVATDGAASGAEDTTITGTVAANATDAENDPLTFALVSTAVDGQGHPVSGLTFNSNGSYSFTPPADFNGIVTFTYKANDAADDSNIATVTLTVTPVNDAPVGAGATVGTNEDVALAGMLPVATDIDGDTLTYTKASDPAHGSVVVGAGGTYTYTPAKDYVGADSFNYTASDGKGGSATYTVNVNIAPVNDAPVLANPIADQSVAEDTAWSFTVPANSFSDVDGDTLTYSATLDDGSALPSWLTFTAATRTFTGTPPQDWNGSLDIKVTASDGSLPASDLFKLTVTPVNDAPVVANALVDQATPINKAFDYTVPMDAFADADGQTLSYSATLSDGRALPAWLTFDPQTRSFSGTPAPADVDTYIIRVTASDGSLATSDIFTITVGNAAPVAHADTGAVTENEIASFDVLGNDTDADSGDSKTLISLGTVSVTSANAAISGVSASGAFAIDNGRIKFTPGALFDGLAAGQAATATIAYTMRDAAGATSSSTLTLTITGTNDGAAISGTRTGSLSEDGAATTGGVLMVTDVDTGEAAFRAPDTLAGVYGSFTFDAVTGAWGYTLDNGAAGVQALKAGQTVTDRLTVTSLDGTASETIDVIITGTNDAPTTSAVTLTVIAEDSGARTITQAELLGRASDIDGDAMTAIGLTITSGAGTLVDNGDGSWTYTPAANDDSSVSFGYLISDGHGGTAATASLDITPVNDAPVAGDDSGLAAEDMPVTFTAAQLLGNDTDVDNAILSVTAVGNAQHGTVALNSDGTVTFTPAANYYGLASFEYTVSDGSLTDTGTVTIEVTSVNDAPVAAAARTVTTAEDTAAQITVTATDVDGDSLTYTAGAAQHGTIAGGANGVFTYTPNANFFGTDSFAVTVADGHGGTAVQTVTVEVTSINDAPTAPLINSVTTDEDKASAAVNIGATDIDGDTLSYAVKTGAGPAKGSVTFNQAAGTFVYTPTADASGADSFTILVSDGNGGTVAQLVNVTITPVNDAPVFNACTNPAPVAEMPGVVPQDLSALSGTVEVADVDIGQTLTLSIAGPATAAWSGGALPAGVDVSPLLAAGAISFDGTRASGGRRTFNWIYDPAAADISWLKGGETLTITYLAQVGDGTATSSGQPLSITITGIGDVTPENLIMVEGGSTGNLLADLLANDPAPSSAWQLGRIDAAGLIGSLGFDQAGQSLVYKGSVDVADGQMLTSGFRYYVDDAGKPSSAAVGVTLLSDTIAGTIAGTAADDIIYGNGSANDISGLGGSDVIYGGAGDDILRGGAGTDRLYGGADNDIVEGDFLDLVIDGGTGTDLGRLDFSTYTQAISFAVAANLAGAVRLGSTAISGFERVQFLGGSGADTLTGGNLDDILVGAGGADTLMGGTGDDIIEGNVGDILLDGGAGVVDLLRLDLSARSDNLNVNLEVIQTSNGQMVAGTQIIGFERLDVKTGSGNDSVVGHVGADIIDAGDGQDIIWGHYGGADIIFAGPGNDQVLTTWAAKLVDGGTGTDYLDINFSGYAGAIRLSVPDMAQSSEIVAGAVTLRGFERVRVIGTSGDDVLEGGDLADTLIGGPGADIIRGGDGVDDITGGAGDIILDGGANNANAKLDFSAVPSTENIVYSIEETINNKGTAIIWGTEVRNIIWLQDFISGAGNDTLSGGFTHDVYHGRDGDDIIKGEGGNDTLYGDNGNDTLDGGAGNDTLDGGIGIDIAAYAGSATDYTGKHNPDGSYTITNIRDGSIDTLTGIEYLKFGSDVPVDIQLLYG